jgi:hypothetical protein
MDACPATYWRIYSKSACWARATSGAPIPAITEATAEVGKVRREMVMRLSKDVFLLLLLGSRRAQIIQNATNVKPSVRNSRVRTAGNGSTFVRCND